MERKNGGRIIAIIALVIAVIGLSLGFAAYSTSLQISSVANARPNNNWNVGFSTDGTNIADVTTATALSGKDEENANDGSVDVTKYTINQTSNSNATLETKTGSQVTYTLSVLNKGTLTAYGDSLTFATHPVTCSNPTSSSSSVIEGTADAGTSLTGGNTVSITQEECEAMFGVSLTIGGTEYIAGQSTTGFGSTTISPSGSTPAILKIWYKADNAANTAAAKLDGDIIVTAGTITAVYKSNNS